MASPVDATRASDGTTVDQLYQIEKKYRQDHKIKDSGRNIMYLRQQGEKSYTRRPFVFTGQINLSPGAIAYFPRFARISPTNPEPSKGFFLEGPPVASGPPTASRKIRRVSECQKLADNARTVFITGALVITAIIMTILFAGSSPHPRR